jgi:anti-sigma B factor antagonist
MKFKDRVSDGIAVIELAGKIMDDNDSTAFRGRLHELLDLQFKNFVIDMSRVEWISSVGLGILIRAHKAVTESGGRLVLAKVEGKSEQLMTITRLITKIPHFDSTEEALTALNR